MDESNPVSVALKVIAWLIIVVGSVVALGSSLVVLIYSVVTGIVLLGFSEIIRLLAEINHKIPNTNQQEEIVIPYKGPKKQLATEKIIRFTDSWDFDEKFKGSVMRNYSTEGKKINNIYPTPVKHCCVIDVEGELHIVLNKNNLPIRLSESDINKIPELKKWYEENLYV
jgi:hypothetical protein